MPKKCKKPKGKKPTKAPEAKTTQDKQDLQPQVAGNTPTSQKGFPLSELVTIDINRVESSKPAKYTSNEKGLRKIEDESDKNYHEVVSSIVAAANDHLKDQDKCKSRIRKICLVFFISFLGVQLLVVFLLIILSACCEVPFHISDDLLTTIIRIMFVETLGAISVMISFAFASKDEVETIGLLTAVVQNYQKYHGVEDNKENDATPEKETDKKAAKPG